MDTVAVVDEPAVTVPEVGETEMEKSLPGLVVQVGSPDWAGTATAFHARGCG